MEGEMATRYFRDLIENQWSKNRFLCVGLDSDFDKIPESVRRISVADAMHLFNRSIIEGVSDLACAFKINPYFYLSEGQAGFSALTWTVNCVNHFAPETPIILDIKAGDVPHVNKKIARLAFDVWGFDAITVNPFVGGKALELFLEYAGKGIFVLCRTSNPESDEFQELKLGYKGAPPTLTMNLYEQIAYRVANEWWKNENFGLVAAATSPSALKMVRRAAPNMPILMPGIGEQGADLKMAIWAGLDKRNKGIIPTASRSILFASDGPDFAEAALREAERLNNEIRECISQKPL